MFQDWTQVLTFLNYFIFDRIVSVLVTFCQWRHTVMRIIRTLNLISVQSWTHLLWPGARFSKAHHFGYSSENLSKIYTLGFVKLPTFSMVNCGLSSFFLSSWLPDPSSFPLGFSLASALWSEVVVTSGWLSSGLLSSGLFSAGFSLLGCSSCENDFLC